MANIVIYDPNDSIVANRVLQYLISVNTPDYSGNILVNPDISSVSNVSMNYWKINNELIEEMTEEEKSAIDLSINSKNSPIKNFLVKEYNNGIIIKEIWYEIDNGDGTYSIKSEEIEYVYNNKKLDSRIVTYYSYDGSEINKEKWEYYVNGSYIIEKKIMEE